MAKYIFTLLFVITLYSCKESEESQNISIITYNIRYDNVTDGDNAWKHRKGVLTSQLQFYSPDIFGIQEAMPHQVNYISKALPQYDYQGIGRDGINKGESSNIFYKNERFVLKESNTFWLSKTPNKISKGWDAALNRICTYVLLQDKTSKKFIWVFNTHLDHIGEQAKTQGLQLILSKIKSTNINGYPVVLMGDFNSEPNTERMVELKKEMNDSRDITEVKPFGPLGTFNGFKHNKPVTKLIDYIFISKKSNIKVKKYAVLSDSKDLKYPSDHFPVYTELEIN